MGMEDELEQALERGRGRVLSSFTQLRCLSCGWAWIMRRGAKTLPKTCPRCHSLGWNDLNRLIRKKRKWPAPPEGIVALWVSNQRNINRRNRIDD